MPSRRFVPSYLPTNLPTYLQPVQYHARIVYVRRRSVSLPIELVRALVVRDYGSPHFFFDGTPLRDRARLCALIPKTRKTTITVGGVQ
jgi:hypothetical protein